MRLGFSNAIISKLIDNLIIKLSMETPQKQKLRQEAESLKQRLQSDLVKF